MRAGVWALVFVLAGCSVFHQPSYEEKLGWAHENGLPTEGAVSEEDGWVVRLKLNDRCNGLLTFESEDAEDPGSYKLKVVPASGGDVLDTVEEAKISTFATDFPQGNVTTAVKKACLS